LSPASLSPQYEDAFTPYRLQSWSVPPPGRQRPLLREGSTTIIADDRGHLLPDVPRSQVSPWGTFVGTWEMPPRIPPARLNLTSRSAAAAGRLTDWIHRPTTLTHACNGIRTHVTGKGHLPQRVAVTQEPALPPPSPRTSWGTFTSPRGRQRRAGSRPGPAPQTG
uniref:Protein Flattop n=1 Tax=Calidris pygmaea TaxID=425635 RepID=A0A8C3J5C8_9CHAR